MKKIVWLTVFSLLFFLTSVAQNTTLSVTGVVFNASGPGPIPVENQAVNIMIDSTGTAFSYQNTVFTDNAGFYSDEIELPPDVLFGFVTVSTYDSCLGFEQYNVGFFGQGAQLPPLDFFLCENIPQDCMAMFYWDYDPANPLSIQFYDMSYGSYDTWLWDFGDGNTSTDANPMHTYSGEGLYEVCLTISDSAGFCSSTSCDLIPVGQINWECQNYFNYYFTDSLTAVFTGYLIDSTFNVLSYEWDFGDGTTATGQTVTHTFTPGGNAGFLVCLTTIAANNAGDTCVSVSCQEVLPGGPPLSCDSYFFPVNQYDLTVDFQAFTVSPYPTEYSWDFGDNTTGTGEFVSHTYPQEGIYPVTLTSIDSTGCESEFMMDVTVGNGGWDCVNWFDYWPDGLTLDFSGYVLNGLPAEYTWEFGDGTSGTGQQIAHTYASSGMYVVTLNTVDSTGCAYTTSMDVWVDVNPLFGIAGYVILENGVFADDATVRLMATDSLWQNVVELASTSINDSGFYQFDSIPMSNAQLFFVQAELNEGSAWFGQYLPTYHISALTWQEAMPVLPFPNWSIDVIMIPGTPVNSGTGTITGNVVNLSSRDVVEGMEVMLMTESMEPITYTRSDQEGEFRFENLAFGTYMIHAEMMGMNSTPAPVTLHEQQPEASVEVQVSDGEVSYVFSVTERLSILQAAGQAYPNPATGNARIEFTSSKPATFRLDIYNQVGQRTWSELIDLPAGAKQVILPTEQLPAGFYYLTATSTEGDFVTRRIVISK